MKRYAWLPLLTLGFATACQDGIVAPERALPLDRGPTASVVDEYAGGPVHGAIFTTTPDGGIVNENVRYTQKIEVYLDGGPRNHVKQTAAGMPDGLYVFQITDPPGKVLLSEDPSKCRVVRIDDGIIVELVAPANIPGFSLTNSYTVGNGGNAVTYPCHVADNAPHPTNPGVAGASGRHDTNYDVDHGADGAIVVQMMPFYDTPNPGGVYKAWMQPLQEYLAKGGVLTAVPTEYKVQGKKVGYQRDAGFGPPRNNTKTDNFKVRENPPFIIVEKYDDLNGNGALDPGEPSISGWPIAVIEPVEGGTVTNFYTTPTDPIKVPFSTTVKVCEQVVSPWVFSFALVGGVATATTDVTINSLPYKCVDVTTGTTATSITVAFGNWEPAEKSGYKFHDTNKNAAWDKLLGESGLSGWEIRLFGTDGKGNAVSRTTYTAAGGKYAFTALPPGTYTVCEVMKTDKPWAQTFPAAANATLGYVDCTTHNTAFGPLGHGVTLISGDVHENNDFGNVDQFHGCTPGYWKQSQHFGNWTAPYSPVPPQTLLSTAFTHYTGQGGYSPTMTMLQALDLDNSVGIGQVLRHGVAALLNSVNGSMTYPLSETGVKNLVNGALDAYDAGNQTYVNSVHATLAGYNESSALGCPLARAELP